MLSYKHLFIHLAYYDIIGIGFMGGFPTAPWDFIVCRRLSIIGEIAACIYSRVKSNLWEGVLLMAGKCEICGKIPGFGNSVSHSKRHTKRMWMPNIHKARLVINGEKKRLNICTRCLRTMHKGSR